MYILNYNTHPKIDTKKDISTARHFSFRLSSSFMSKPVENENEILPFYKIKQHATITL
jgi:hypothetical protein